MSITVAIASAQRLLGACWLPTATVPLNADSGPQRIIPLRLLFSATLLLAASTAWAQTEEEGYPIGEHGGQVIDITDPDQAATGVRRGVSTRGGGVTISRQPELPHMPLPPLPPAFDALKTPQGQAVPRSVANASAQPPSKLTAEEVDAMVQKLAAGDYTLPEKQRMVAEIFYHSPEYRAAVLRGEFSAKSPGVQVFLAGKKEMQRDVIRRMGELHKQKYGVAPSGPVIPFDYNNIHSDDDIITGSGQLAAKLEDFYNEALNQVISERTGRTLTAADRLKIDVNGLSWNMTLEGGIENYKNPEKYINPQTGFDNQQKLAGGNLEVLTWDSDGNMVVLTGEDARLALRELDVERPLDIPGIEPKAGSGVIADNLRMADLHKVEFEPGRIANEGEIGHFIRNQKYTKRVDDPFQQVAADMHPGINNRYGNFLELSANIRAQTNIRDVAKVLDGHYGEKIIVDGVVDRAALTRAMQKHQALQLQNVMPEMLRAVTENEAVKMAAWLKAASGPDRHTLRKQLALTYAPVDEVQRQRVLDDLDKLDIDADEKAFLRHAVDKDAKRLVRYAELADMDVRKLVNGLELRGDSFLAVDLEIMNYRPVKQMGEALWELPGGKQFKDFLRSKTARALNLDVMLDVDIGTRGEKVMQWSMVMLAAGRAYAAGSNQTESFKGMAKALFEMIPGVSATLRFSEGEFHQAFKDITMDVLPPVALADLAVSVLHFTGEFAIETFVDGQLDEVARTELARLGEQDFVESDYIPGYFILRDRESYFEFMKEVSAGLGSGLAKYSSLVTRQVDAIQRSNRTYQINIKALHTLNYFEEVPEKTIQGQIERRFSPLELKQRVWESGIPGIGEASSVQRVAAKLIAENLAIRAAAADQVLNQLLNRIENFYNEKHGRMDVVGASRLMDVRLKLKDLYENAPDIIKKNAFTGPELEEEYRVRDEYLRDYSIEGFVTQQLRSITGFVDDTKFKREMQSLLDGFKAVIEQLLIAAGFFDEARDLQLVADYYGGNDSMKPLHGTSGDPHGESMLLMGDEFRVGISARVSRHRKGQDWTVYYYTIQGGAPVLLGSRRLTPSRYAEGDALMVIEAPEPETFLHVKGEQREKYFGDSSAVPIYPVLAFGDWERDPVQQVGIAALNSPAEYFEQFSNGAMAYLGEPLTVRQMEPFVKLEVPDYVTAPEQRVTAKLHVKVPAYARNDVMEARIEVVPGDSDGVPPEAMPASYGRVSTDDERPDEIVLQFSEATTFGYYTLKAKVRLARVGMDHQPGPQQDYFQYLPAEDGKPGEERQQLAGLMAQLRDIAAQTRALAAGSAATHTQITRESGTLVTDLYEFAQGLLALDSQLDALRDQPLGRADANRIILLEKDVYSGGLRLGEIRSRIEQLALHVCENYENIRARNSVLELDSIFADMRVNQQEVLRLDQQFQQLVAKMGALKTQAEAEYAAGTGKQPGLELYRTQLQTQRTRHQGLAAAAATLQGLVDRQVERQNEAFALQERAAGLKTRLEAEGVENGDIPAEATELMGSILADAGQVGDHAGSSTGAIETAVSLSSQIAATLDSMEAKLTERAVAGTDSVLARALEQAMSQFNSSYEAGMLFAEPIRFAVSSTGTCMNVAGPVYRDKTRPEIRVAQTDCSGYPGTRAKWQSEQRKVVCACPSSQDFSTTIGRCVDNRTAAVASTDCRQWPHSEAVWSERDQRATCTCVGPYRWSDSQQACVDSSEELARANCSAYGPAQALWNESSGGAYCDCRSGYDWNSAGNYCVPIGYAGDGYQSNDSNGGYQSNGSNGGYATGETGVEDNRPRCTGNEAYDRVLRGTFAGGCNDGSASGADSGSNSGTNSGASGYTPVPLDGCRWNPPGEVNIYGLPGQGVAVGWTCHCFENGTSHLANASRCGPRPQ